MRPCGSWRSAWTPRPRPGRAASRARAEGAAAAPIRRRRAGRRGPPSSR
jgi:hypothetical protein